VVSVVAFLAIALPTLTVPLATVLAALTAAEPTAKLALIAVAPTATAVDATVRTVQPLDASATETQIPQRMFILDIEM
jgi:hypothetical protein